MSVRYSDEEIAQCLAFDEKQKEADAEMETLREYFTTNMDGWVSSDVYDQAKSRVADMREKTLEAADTEEERKVIEENWPFQDHVEID